MPKRDLTACFAAISVTVALLCGFIISWSFIVPLRRAQDFLGQVTAGDLGATIAVPNRDEFGAQAARMNRMARELQRLVDEQQQTAAELREYAGLEKACTVIGVRNKLEIWNPPTWAAYTRTQEEAFANLSEELFLD